MSDLLTPEDALALERARLRWLADAAERLLRRTVEKRTTEEENDD